MTKTIKDETADTKKKPAKKAPAKKAASKTAAKKAPAKKAAAKTPAKKTAAKPAAKKAPAKKAAKAAKPVAPAEEPKAPAAPQAAATPVKPAPAAPVKPAPAAAPQAAPKEAAKPAPAPQPAPQPSVRPAAPAPQPKPAPQVPPAAPKPQPAPQKPAPKAPEKAPAAPQGKVVRLIGTETVKDLAEKMNFKINDFIKKLMMMGVFATINQRLEKDMVELICSECGYSIEEAAAELDEDTLHIMQAQDDPASLKPRSPVITIMGHVDHGKTSLLDAIRSSNVVAGEAGAITQHIGAYRVRTPKGELTFLDTPGHEAFTAMRARGAQATDIVVLVVSATDGIMPQTIEAMEHAKAAGAPIIVAVNKIDLPGANVDRVKQDLAARGLVPEEWQGSTIFVEISAKQKINIDKLLEMIALQAEMMELKANPDRLGVGVILESKRDNKRGVVATVLVQKGTMKVGEPFIVGTSYGRIRALIDENGARYQKIGPSVPAEILGINGEPPQVGDTLYIMESEKEARFAAEKRKLAQKEDVNARRAKQVSLMNLRKDENGENTVKRLPIVLKADVQGSLEAIKDALLRIPADEVELDIILSAPGNINESDILLAKASSAIVIGFHVNVENKAKDEADREGIEIRLYTIIFELLEDIKAAMEGLLEPDVVEVSLGKATIKKVMRLSSGIISGSLVDEGKMVRGAEVKVLRNGQEVGKGKIGGLKRFKDDVKEVEKGFECGILVEGYKAVQEGDVIECIKHENVTRRITM